MVSRGGRNGATGRLFFYCSKGLLQELCEEASVRRNFFSEKSFQKLNKNKRGYTR
jgi:hypothetical protein